MPVTIEAIHQPSGQDLEDLQRIYEDAPHWMLEDWQSPDHAIAIKGLLESVEKSSSRQLFAARFNSRLLGAVLVDEENDAWLLHRLCVRNLTRNRGVGSRLLGQVVEMARKTQKSIRLHDPERQLRHEQLTPLGDYQLVESAFA